MTPSFVISVVFSLSSVSMTLASFAIQPATVHPSRPDTCFNKDTNSFYEDGDSWNAGCSMASCLKIRQPSGKSQMMISFEGCGSEGYEPPCYLEEDLTAEFPDCCPQVVCPDSTEQDDKTLEDIDNEVGTLLPKNETSKPSTLEAYKDSYSKQERQWREANNDLGLQVLEDNADDSSESQDLFRRKFSPKFYYW